MTHFLARLVERARGTAPRIEPIIAPRFAPAAVVKIASETEAAPPSRREVRSPGAIESPNLTFVSEERIELARPEGELTERSIEPVREEPLVPEIPATPTPLIVRPANMESQPMPVLRNGAVPGASAPRSKIARPRSATPATTPARTRRSTELPNESRTEPPIVRVTIGRIEVRAAPLPVAPPPKAAPNSGPKLTLDAYLKSRKEGAR